MRRRAGAVRDATPGAAAVRRTGIKAVGDAPWGTHFCQFYATSDDLVDTLVPYFKAGLESGEFCMWVTSPPLGVAQARAALAKAVPDLESFERRGRLEILPHTDWYLAGGHFDSDRVLAGWVSRLDEALARGCAGLRLTGNTFWLEKADWRGFYEYEAAVDAVLGRYRMLALCTYSLQRCGAAEIADVIRNHQFALLKRDGAWEIIESFDRRRLEDTHAREIAFERERLATTLQSIGDAVIATDTAGRVVLLNGVAEQLTGWKLDEARDRPLSEVFRIVDEGTGAPAADPVAKVLRSGRPEMLANHTALVSRSGRSVSVADSAAPIRGPAGDVSGVVLVFRDVTSARVAEERLRSSEERHRQLFLNLSEGFALHEMIFDADGSPRDYRFVEVNPAFERLTGLKRSQVVGRTAREVIPGLEPEWIERYGRVVLTGEPARFESRADPLGRDYEVIAYRPQPGQFAAVFMDVTERRSMDRALRRSEARLGLLSRTAARLLAADEPQTVVEALCREVMGHLDCQVFLNYLADEPSGKLHLNACAGIDAQAARDVEWLEFGSAICGCVARDMRSIVAERIQDGADPRAALVRSHGVRTYCCHPLVAQGRLIGTLSFGTKTRDRFADDEAELMRVVADQVATAMQRVESVRALSAANAQLVEADRRKNEFLAMLSHELRNPLAPIRNSLYVLDHAAPGGEQARRAHQVMDRQVNQLASLVNDLLDVTRITRNKIALQKESVELGEMVHRALEDNRSFFERAEVTLELVAAQAPAHVHADRTRLAQIVGNLLQNAAKFAHPGGRTRVVVGTEEGQAVVRVVDDGIGMEPRTLARLFQPFMQAEQGLDRGRGGLGLGLALVKGLVELHGGTISAHSDGLGKGSEFVVRLPLEASAPVRPAAPDRTQTRRGARRVLVIEDNADAAESLREALELGEHVVEIAATGPEGVERARAFRPDVVLCDVGLPGMDGYEVARALRSDGSPDAMLVALSGYALPEDLRRAAEAGFAHHVAKPPSIAKLEEILAAAPARDGAPS